MYTLKLKHNFSAAHQLTHAYSKECNDYKHGHNWKVAIEINTNKLADNMVVDFKKLKEVINQLDHRDLNTILTFEPTAENLTKYLYDEILKLNSYEDIIWLVKVTIWEADNASITYEI